MTATYKVILHRIEINIVIIAVTFGFDEKFAVRALMRHPFGQYKSYDGGGFEPPISGL